MLYITPAIIASDRHRLIRSPPKPMTPISNMAPKPFPATRGRTLRIPHIPLFERLVYYLLLPDLFCRVVLELGAGMYWYFLTQPKQWVFYGVMLIEYLLQLRSFARVRYVKSGNHMAAFLFLIMFLHGLLGGVAWGNAPAKIITDSIPVMVVALNIILLSRVDAFDGFSLKRLTIAIRGYSLIMVLAGTLAVAMGRPSIVSLGGSAGTPICLAVLLVTMMIKRRIAALDVIILGMILVPIAPNLTRTTLLAFMLAFGIFVAPKVFRSGIAIYTSIMVVMLTAVSFPMIVPEDSPLMIRIRGTLQMAENSTSASAAGEGSLGERTAEVEAIAEEMDRRGLNAHMFGLGAGGIYQVEFSGGRVPENYSHAHFGWALFKLRYGYIGYFYLTCFAFLLMANIWRTLRSPLPENRMVGMFGLWGFLFIFTYMFYNQLVAGLQFAMHQPAARALPASGRRKRNIDASSTMQVSRPVA